MKNNMLVCSLIFFQILSACQYSEQAGPHGAAPSPLVSGPSDGGGGDTCNGKMIESFKIDIQGLPEYQKYLAPLFSKAADSSAGSDEVQVLPLSIAPRLKNWYLIDCKLQDIPKERKGLYLETYQTAIHTSGEIFIDKASYEQMPSEEKAKLLLHEMVMAYYLTKYSSVRELCKVVGDCGSDIDLISTWQIFKPQAYRPLDESDHQKIRKVTAWLWNNPDLSADAFRKVLEDNDFDTRFIQGSAKEVEKIQVSAQTLLRMFKKHNWSQAFPKFCDFNAETGASGSLCETEVTATYEKESQTFRVPTLKLQVEIRRVRDQRTFKGDFILPLFNESYDLHVGRFGRYIKGAPMTIFANWPNFTGVEAKEGLKSQALTFLLNVSDKENLEIFQVSLNEYVWYSFEEETLTKDGEDYIATYGYVALLKDSSETLHSEPILPFPLRFKMNARNFVGFRSAKK